MTSEASNKVDEVQLQAPSLFPEVETFFSDFYSAICDRDYEFLKQLYEHNFNKLTESFYSNSRWPSDKIVEKFYEEKQMQNGVITSLYRELYYRHVFARCSSTVAWSDRFSSSSNYMRLIEYFINVECDPENDSKLAIPEQWLWDMVDEFCNQFQETQRWKAQYAKDIAKNEIAMKSLHTGRDAWRTSNVLGILCGIVEASKIKQWLQENKRTLPDISRTTVANLESSIFLGYFCLICLVRVHVTLGDYYTALWLAEPIELSTKALYWSVPLCHVTLFYNLGFAYMMLRRYQDAIQVLSQFLTFLSKNQNYITSQVNQQEIMLRMAEKMYLVVMLCNSMSPTRIDETIQTQIQERWSDFCARLQSDEEHIMQEIFIKACPSFINALTSDYDNTNEQALIDEGEPMKRQLNIFLKDVLFQNKIYNLRSIAKLYNNLTLTKLANLMNVQGQNAAETMRSEVLCVKYRAQQLRWRSGPYLSGERVETLTDLDIYIDIDSIHVKNLTPHSNYIEDFVKQIQKTQELFNAPVLTSP